MNTQTYNTMSANIRSLSTNSIYNILRNYSKFRGLGNNILRFTAQLIEGSCYRANIQEAQEKNMRPCWSSSEYLDQYSNILYTVLVNLDPESSINCGNTYLIDAVGTQIIFILSTLSMRAQSYKYNRFPVHQYLSTLPMLDLEKLGIYHHDILNPTANKIYKDEIEIRSQQCIVVKTTKMYICPECGGRDSKYHVQQTRSGDEGYTVFITCQICGFRYVTYS